MNKKIFLILVTLVLIISVFCACAPAVEPDKLTLSHENATIIVGQSFTISASGGAEEVSWSSSNSSVATVENGVITAIKYGQAEIIATSGDETAKCIVTVVFASTNYTVRVNLDANAITLNTFYANTRTYDLTATVTDNGTPIQKTIEWASSNSAVATVENGKVTAISNGVANITATVREGNKFASALCVVTVQDDVEIKINGAMDKVKAGETLNLSAEVKVNGTNKSDVEISWTSSDESIATITNSGVLTTYSGGYVVISASALGQTQEIGILVGDVIIVSSAEDFLNMDKGDETTLYKLESNLDLSSYFATNVWQSGSLIDNFSSTFDGQGYAVTGIKRMANFGEKAGEGLFGNITDTAVIQNAYIEIDYVLMSEGASVFASELNGKIKNSYIKAKVYDLSNGESEKTAMIGNNLGSTDFNDPSVYRTIFDIKATDGAMQTTAITPFSTNGAGAYSEVIVISDEYPTYSAYVNGFNGTANANTRLCFAYPTTSDFVNGTSGTKISSSAISGKAFGKKHLSWSDKWNIDQTLSTVGFSNDKSLPVTYAPSIETVVYTTSYKKNDAITIITPSYQNNSGNQTGLNLTYDVFDSLGRSVLSQVEEDVFTPTSIGNYTIVYTVTDTATGYTNLSDAKIVVEDGVTIDTGVKFELVLPINGTKTLAPTIKGYDGGTWTFSSSDQTVATVDTNGTITARSSGYAVINVKHNETERENKVVLRSYENMVAINSEEDFIAMGEKENPNDYYYLTKDLDFSSVNYLSVNMVSTSNVKCYTVTKKLYGTFDGNGYTITFNFDDLTSGLPAKESRQIGGLFLEITRGAKVKNMILYSDIKPQAGKGASYLAYSHRGEIIDSYFNLVSETSNAERAYACSLVANTALYQETVYGSFTRCILNFNSTANGLLSNSGGFANHFSWGNWATFDRNARMTDCMIIGKENKWLMISIGDKKRCYGYSSFENFFAGVGYHSVTEAYSWGNMDLSNPNTDTPAYTHAGFVMSQWDIKDGSIKLCGREVDIVSDEIYSYSDGLTVKWNAVEGATSYKVYKGSELICTTDVPMFKALDNAGNKTSDEYAIKVVPVFDGIDGKHYTVNSVKFNVKGTVSNVTELKALKNETDASAIYVLRNDITISQEDMEWFMVDTSAGDGSNANVSVLSVIDSLRCTLNGNGHKITITLDENSLTGNKTFASQSGESKGVGGLVADMKPGSKVTNVYFDVTTNIVSNVRVGACAYLSYGKFESCYVDFKYNRPNSIDYSDRKITMCAFTITWNGRTKEENHGHFDSCILKIVARNTSNGSVIKSGGFGGIYDGGAWTAKDQFTRLNKFDNCIFISETGANTVFSNVSGARKNCYVFESTNALKTGSGYKLLSAFNGYTYIGQAGASDNNSQNCNGPSAQLVPASQSVHADTANWNNGTWSINESTVKFYDYIIG